MDHKTILARLDHQRRTLVRDDEVKDVLPSVTRLRGEDNSWHMLIFSSLSADNADAVIEQELAHHAALNADFEWKLFEHDTPADLRTRLEKHGFTIGPCEAVMIYDLSKRPAWLTEPGNVVRVERLEQIGIYRTVAAEVFNKDYSMTTRALTRALNTGSPQNRGYLALSGNAAVGVGRLCTHPSSEFAGLYGGGTLAEHRRQGHYRALIAARARDAMALGARYLQVDALPTSRPILERLGFECLTHTWPCEWSPGR